MTLISAEMIANTPYINRKRHVLLSDYYGDPDGAIPADAFTRTQAFFTAAQGREGVIDTPTGASSGVFRLDQRTAGNLVLPTRGRLIFEGALDFSAYGTSGTRRRYMISSGTAGANLAVGSDLSIGQDSLTVPAGAAATWKPGDVVHVGATGAVYTTTYPTVYPAEWQRIKSISGDVVTFYGFLRGTYTVANGAFVRRIEPTRIRIDNPRFVGAGPFAAAAASGDYGITIALGDGVVITGGEGRFADSNNLVIDNCIDWTVRDFASIHDIRSDRIQYGIAILGASDGGLVDNPHCIGGRHGVCWTNGGSVTGIQPGGIARNDRLNGGFFQGTYHYAVATHTNHEKLVIGGGTIIEACGGGVDIRVQEVEIDKLWVRNPIGGKAGALGCGINLRERIGKVRITNARTLNCRFGIRAPASEAPETGESSLIEGNVSDITITGCHFEDSSKAIELQSDTTATLGTISLSNNVIDKTESHAVDVLGHWDRPNISRNTFLNGPTGARCIWLRGASVPLGVINPIVRHNDYDAGYTDPLIQNVSGLARVEANILIGTAAAPVPFAEVTLAQLLALDPTTSKGPYRVTDVGASIWISNGTFWTPTGPVKLAGTNTPGTPITTTTGTRIDALSPVLIRAGLLRNGRRIEADATFSYTNSANAKTLRVTLGGTAGTAGTIYAQLAPTTTATARIKAMIVAEGDTAQRGPAAALYGGTGPSTGAIVVSAVDATADSYLRVTGELANAADTITLDTSTFWLFP